MLAENLANLSGLIQLLLPGLNFEPKCHSMDKIILHIYSSLRERSRVKGIIESLQLNQVRLKSTTNLIALKNFVENAIDIPIIIYDTRNNSSLLSSSNYLNTISSINSYIILLVSQTQTRLPGIMNLDDRILGIIDEKYIPIMLPMIIKRGLKLWHIEHYPHLQKNQNDVSLRNFKKTDKKASLNKDTFLSLLAHDLKGSFNGLIGFSEILWNDYHELNDDKRKRYINKIKNLSENTYKLLNNLLLWSKSHDGNIVCNSKWFCLESSVQSVIDLYNEQAKSKGVSVVSFVKKDLTTYGDQNMIETILRNFISNAIKYSYQGGDIIIRAYKTTDCIFIVVEDNGIGISNQKISKLFNTHNNTTTPGTLMEEGSGFGLLLSKELIELNNGKIWVESKLGEGSKFVFTLPLVRKPMLSNA